MSIRLQALLGTILSIAAVVYFTLEMMFAPSRTSNPATGQTFEILSLGRTHHHEFVTHDQSWALVVIGGVFLACFVILVVMFEVVVFIVFLIASCDGTSGAGRSGGGLLRSAARRSDPRRSAHRRLG